jgi:CW-type Zinc Finger
MRRIRRHMSKVTKRTPLDIDLTEKTTSAARSTIRGYKATQSGIETVVRPKSKIPVFSAGECTENKAPRSKRKITDRVYNSDGTNTDVIEWVQCTLCTKWRILPDNISSFSLPDDWDCSMISWRSEKLRNCEVAEDTPLFNLSPRSSQAASSVKPYNMNVDIHHSRGNMLKVLNVNDLKNCGLKSTFTEESTDSSLIGARSSINDHSHHPFKRPRLRHKQPVAQSTQITIDPNLAEQVLFDAQNTTKLVTENQAKATKGNPKAAAIPLRLPQQLSEFFLNCPDELLMSIEIPGETREFIVQPAEVDVLDEEFSSIPVDSLRTINKTVDIKVEDGLLREYRDEWDFFENCPDEVFLSIPIDPLGTANKAVNIKVEDGLLREYKDEMDFFENCPDEVFLSIGIQDEYRMI